MWFLHSMYKQVSGEEPCEKKNHITKTSCHSWRGQSLPNLTLQYYIFNVRFKFPSELTRNK